MRNRILHLLTCFDQLIFCCFTLGKHPSYRTVSASLYVWERKGSRIGKACRICIDTLFRPLRTDHCLEAFLSELIFENRYPYK